jgi:putative ABC transport system permease protein
MEELFGLSMTTVMQAVFIAFALIVLAVGLLALMNRIVFKIGVRNIPRRPAQTILILVGLMLSTLIISAALGTGDTLSFSIRNEVFRGLGAVDEVLTSGRSISFGDFRSNPYFPVSQFEELRAALQGNEAIDGLAPQIAEQAPVVNPQARQSVGGMRVAAIEPASASSFGPIRSISGGEARLDDLLANEVFLNQPAAEELNVKAGDEVQLFYQDRAISLRVKDVVQKGGLAGDDETMLMSLAQGQQIFGKPGQINSVLVSNRGDSRAGAELSEKVTEQLRQQLTNSQVAQQLKAILSDGARVAAIRQRADDQLGKLQLDMRELATLLEEDVGANPAPTPRLLSLLADDGVAMQAQLAVEGLNDDAATAQVFALFMQLKTLNVQDVKRDLLDIADLAASAVTSIFVVFGLFSMMAGVMLIFLIFVMLAAERKAEMGISRAIGMKRRHLVQAFIYEGMAYDLASALVGALLGIVVGFALVTIMASIFAAEDEGFTLTRSYTLRSFIVAYSIGVVLTFLTVFFSSYRASRLNIVSAIRDLPEDVFALSRQEPRLRLIGRSLARPFIFLARALRALRHLRVGGFIGNLALAAVWLFIWPADIAWNLVRASSGALSQGWLTFLLGAALVAVGIMVDQAAPHTIGVTMAVIGLGQMLRRFLVRRAWPASRQNGFTAAVIWAVCLFWFVVGITQASAFTVGFAIGIAAFELIRQLAMSRERVVSDPEDRNAFTFTGLTLLLYWGTPFDVLEFIVPELSSGIEMFFISGICMVAAAVWVVIYNSDLLVDGITAVFGRFSRIRPALKTAVAYSMNSRMRTGLTLAMLALVIFTLIVMSSLTTAFGSAFADIESVTGGWDIEASVSPNNPIEDIGAALGPVALEIEAVGGYTTLPVEARQVGAETQEWKGYQVRGADPSYLGNTGHDFALFDHDYGETKEDIWRALRDNPRLAVVDALAVPTRQGGGFSFGGPQFRMEGFFFEDEEMPATEVEVRDPRSGMTSRVTVIGVLDARVDQFGVIVTSRDVLGELSSEPLPVTAYRFKVRPGADAATVARSIEATLLQNGVETTVLADEVEESRRQNIAINRLLQGFMASGLLVGIAALGVISFRAVVERRQQIGVLRAIGYKQGMVLASFLMESSFVALLGILLGVGLGTLLSYNLVSFIGEQVPGLKFTVPWLQLGFIVAIAYLFSLLTTVLPARRASRVYPAEALRYE